MSLLGLQRLLKSPTPTPQIEIGYATAFENVGDGCLYMDSDVYATSHCKVDEYFNSTFHRLQADVQHGTTACDGGWETVDSDCGVDGSGYSTTEMHLLVADAETPGGDGTVYAQFRWRIYHRVTALQLDEWQDSCRSATYGYCL